MKAIQNCFLLISIFLINISLQTDVSTFANYEIIQQTKIEVNFNVDFTQKIINGIEKIYFKALEDGEVIVLDTKALIIHSVIDSETGDELDFIVDDYYKLESHGVPLKIYKEFSKNDTFTILINYFTTKAGSAVQFLDKEQTTSLYVYSK